MPLVDRADSTLVVVDAQRVFFDQRTMTKEERAHGAAAAIRDSGRRTAVVGGFETDTCVAQSAIQLHDLGFRVVVPEDAAYTTGDLEHRRGLDQMLRAGVEILHCKGVAFEWLRTVEDATRTLRAAEERFGPPPLRL